MAQHIYGTIRLHPTTPVNPMTEQAVREAVESAEHGHHRVHAVGSAWSSTDVFVSDEVLLQMAQLDQIHVVVGPDIDRTKMGSNVWLHDALHPARRQTYFAYVDAGVTINEIYKALDEVWPRLTIPAMGSSTGQTVAGVLGTGTHGGDVSGSPIADTVHAIRMVVPGHRTFWIEPGGDEVLTRPGWMRRIGRSLGIDEVHQDTELFDAAVTAVGAMGVITAVVLRVVPQFGLSETVTHSSWEAIRPILMQEPVPSMQSLRSLGVREPEGSRALVDLEFLVNPYRRPLRTNRPGLDPFDPPEHDPATDGPWGRPTDIMTRTTNGRWPWSRAPKPGAEDKPPRPDPAIGDSISGVIAAAFGPIPTVGDAITALMSASRFTTGDRFYRSSYLRDTYDGSTILGPGLTSELCISTRDHQHVFFMDALLAAFDEHVRRTRDWFSGFFSCRFQRPSRALMSMQHNDDRDSPHYFHVEIQGLIDVGEAVADALHGAFHGSRFRDRSGDLQGANDEFLRVWENVALERGARLHWGQLNLLNRRLLETTHSETLWRWRKARTQIGYRGHGRTFSNDHSTRVGLESYSEVVALCRSGPRQYDLFGFRENGDLAHLQWDGGQWREPATITNPFGVIGQRVVGPLTCTEGASGGVELFAAGARNRVLLLEQAGPGGVPRDLADLARDERQFNSPMAACTVQRSGQSATRHLFGLDRSGGIIEAHDATGRWTVTHVGDEIDGERCYGRIVATSSGPGSVDIFGVALDGTIVRASRSGTGQWQHGRVPVRLDEGQRLASPLACANRGPDRLDLFALTELGSLVRIRSNGGRWDTSVFQPPRSLGGSVRRSPRAQAQRTGLNAAHYQPVELRRPHTFFGELAAAGQTDRDRVDVVGLGPGQTVGTRVCWYHAWFEGDELVDWVREPARFWEESGR